MAVQGGWCWLSDDGPFWCHHQDCRDAEAKAAALPDDWWR